MTSLPISVEFKVTGVASSVESKVNPGHSLVSNSPNPFLKNIDKHFIKHIILFQIVIDNIIVI